MRSIILLLLFFLFYSFGFANPTYEIRPADKARIKEAISIAKKFGEKIWPGINNIPFAMILVTDSVEFLIHHTNPPADFIFLNKDTVLGTDIHYRKRQYPTSWLATFPINGISCIVAGIPENTGLTSTAWIVTLLHEHFHQYQYSQPDYYADVNNLGLSGGDQTGMWMLNYAFPYEKKEIVTIYEEYVSMLGKTLAATTPKDFRKNEKQVKASRKKLADALSAADHKYFSFQLWQEGIARYTEYKFLELLATYDPLAEVKQLKDFISFSEYKKRFFSSQQEELKKLQLSKDKRICFYAVGFAEGLLLDKFKPGWHSAYLPGKFRLPQ